MEDWGEVGETGRMAWQLPPSRLVVMRPEPRGREGGRDVRIFRMYQFQEELGVGMEEVDREDFHVKGLALETGRDASTEL